MSGEHWRRDVAAEYLGIRPQSVQRVLSRAGVSPLGRVPGGTGGGQSLYDAADVRAYGENRDSRGSYVRSSKRR